MTARLHLVRHGKAAAGWDADPDPGLAPEGRADAQRAAALLAPLGALPVVTSPLRRARETAEIVAARWDVEPVVDAAVSEIPSPTDDLADRGRWLRGVLAGRWSEQGDDLRAWRSGVLDGLRRLAGAGDTVVATHFVVINAAVGAALDDDRVVCESITTGSVTTIAVDADGGLAVESLGRTGSTEVR